VEDPTDVEIPTPLTHVKLMPDLVASDNQILHLVFFVAIVISS